MKSLSKYYNQICTKKYQILGFSRNKLTLIRMCEDIVQAFTFKFSQSTTTCTVDFGIFPLCMPVPIFLDEGGYGLEQFIVEQYEQNWGWTFDPNSDESMINCIKSISQAIDLYLLPIFDTCSDCKSALPELIKLEELFDRNRLKKLHLRGDSDCAIAWQERSLFDARKYYMALKSRNLVYAEQYLFHQIDYLQTSISSLNKPNSPRQPDIVKDRFSAKLALCLEQLERLNSGNLSYFEDLLNSNENQMRKYLAEKYPIIHNR